MYTGINSMNADRLHGGRLAIVLPKGRRFAGICAMVLFSVAVPSAQAPNADAMASAVRALNQGQFEQVDTLLRSSTDPRAIALRARAEIDRGRYAQAEKLLVGPAAASPASDAALERGLLQLRLGRRADATRTLTAILDRSGNARSAADFVRLGLAARALRDFDDANSFFREAISLAPEDVAANTAWGELFLDTYNNQEAAKSFQQALSADPAWVPAQVGLAQAVAAENPPMARQLTDKALAHNPNYVPGLLFLAELDLDDTKRPEARARIERALKVNPNSLEARALAAAIEYLEDRVPAFDAAAKEALEINPVYGEFFRIAGELAARNYRFEEAVALTRRAIALDQNGPRAWSDLGMHLLRTGDEPAARRALETAFKADPYNIVTFNLLAMLDTLDAFETITAGDVVMRLHKDEVGVLREYAMPLAQQALETLSKRYQHKVQGPVLIEIFPKHDDFAVRTLGLPGMVGALGACFGRVVTMDSPKARPPGTFNWGATLWHEVTHVVTLQMSGQRAPRWLSEGISVYEEKRARPAWGRESELSFAQALGQGEILKLKDLNAGFTNPETISLAYYEASLLVEHIVEAFGEPKLHDLVRTYAKGLDNEAALKQALGRTIEQLQISFDQFLDKAFGPLLLALKQPELPAQGATAAELKALIEKHPQSFALHMMLGQALHKQGDADGAIAILERAAALVPVATGAASPHAVIAKIAMERKDTPRAIKAFDALMQADHTDVEFARTLASLVAPLGDPARTAAAYARVVEVDPFDADAQAALGRAAIQLRDASTAIRAFKVALAIGPVDRATAHYNLAEAYVLVGQIGDAKKQTLAALEIAPSFERAQDLLLKLVDGANR